MATWDTPLNSGYVLRHVVSQGTQFPNTNQTDVEWLLKLVRTGGTLYSSGYQNGWYSNIDGNIFQGTKQYNFLQGQTEVILGSGTVRLNHNSDGTKTFGTNAGFTDVANLVGSGEQGIQNATLTAIPRGSTPTVANLSGVLQSHFDAGVAMRIFTNRASTAFTHTIRYTLGSASGTIATGVTASYDWTIPMSLLNQFPSAPIGYGHIYLDTYNGGTLIESGKSVQFAVKTPASVVPTISSITIAEATTGVITNVDAYVQGISKFTVTTNGEAGVYGSTITERKVEVAGQVVKGDPITTGVINASGTVPVKVTVTDSRGKTASITQNVTVLAYATPKITSMSVQRSLSSGTPDESGSYLRVNINASVSSLMNSTQRNSMRYVVYTRVRGVASWGTAKVNTTLPTGTISFNSYVNLTPYLSGTAYDVKVEVFDDYRSISSERQVPVAAIAVHFDGNNGMGVGKYRQDGVLDVAGQIYANDRRPVQYAIAAGRVTGLTTSVASGAKALGSVNFPTNPGGGARFTQIPIVGITGENGRFTWAYNSVSTSGFDWTADNWSPAAGTPTSMSWIAIQMLPSAAAG